MEANITRETTFTLTTKDNEEWEMLWFLVQTAISDMPAGILATECEVDLEKAADFLETLANLT